MRILLPEKVITPRVQLPEVTATIPVRGSAWCKLASVAAGLGCGLISEGYTRSFQVYQVRISAEERTVFTEFPPPPPPWSWKIRRYTAPVTLLTHCGRVTKISVFNTVKLGTSASSS
jgi:hypothetical protein